MVDVAPAVFETFAVCDRVKVRRISFFSLVNLGFVFNQMANVAVFLPSALRLAENDVVHFDVAVLRGRVVGALVAAVYPRPQTTARRAVLDGNPIFQLLLA